MLSQGSLTLSCVPGLYVQAGVAALYDSVLGLHIEDVPYNPGLIA